MTVAPAFLIVDDDLGDRKALRRLLIGSYPSSQLFEAASVEERVEEVGGRAVDLIFVDYRMPRTNGLDAMVTLTESWPEAGMVMVSGRGDEAIAAEAIKLGALDYIRKSQLTEGSVRRIVDTSMEKIRLNRAVADRQAELAAFSNIVVHDLSAPLRAATYFCEMLREALDAGDRGEVDQTVEDIEECLQRLKALINSLKRHIDGNETAELVSVDLNAAVAGALHNLSHEVQTTGARVTLSPLPGVVGDEARLVQLLQNLIGNAIKYCDKPRPEISITASAEGDGLVRLAVNDNGPGIEEQFLQRIFEPFRRLHAHSDIAGTGLGLATCKRIVENHGGQIWCVSSPGAGATFHMTLSVKVA